MNLCATCDNQAAHGLWRSAGRTAISKMTYKPGKLGQTDLVLIYNQSSSVGLCLQDFKSVHVPVVIMIDLCHPC